MKKFILVIVILILSGCGGRQIPVEAVNSVVEGSTETAGLVADASTMKEALSVKRWIEFYKASREIHKNSGVKIKMVMKETKPGVFVQTIEQMEMRQAMSLPKPPDHPSNHPVWKFATDFAKIIGKYGLIAYGIHEFSDLWEATTANAGSTHHGDYNSFNSHNTVGRDNFVESMNPVEGSYNPIEGATE